MPLPNYGYENQEKKTHQDLVFEMAPEIVSDDENSVVNGKKVKSLRGKVGPYLILIFGSDRSPRSQDVCPSVRVCDIMLTSTLEEFPMDLKVLKKGPREGA